MPYSSVNDLPSSVKDNLPTHAKEIYMRAFNSALEQYHSEEKAAKVAWSAVSSKYKKNESGEWVAKSLDFSDVVIPFESKGLKEDGKFHVIGLLSTTDPDYVNDIFTKNCMKSIVNQINGKEIKVVSPKKINLEHEHLTKDSRIIPRGKVVAGELVEDANKPEWAAVKIDAILNSHLPDFQEVKGSVEDGFLDAYSIEFRATKYEFKERNGKKYRIVDDVFVGGAALTGRPANAQCSILDFGIKSLALDEDDLKEGEIMESKSDMMKCKECGKEFNSKEELDKHSETHKKEPEEKKTMETTPTAELEAKNKQIAELEAKNKEVTKQLEEMKSQNDMISKVSATIKEELKSLQPAKTPLADIAPKFDEEKKNLKPFNTGNCLRALYGVKKGGD